MFWRNWKKKAYIKEIGRLLEPIYVTAKYHRQNYDPASEDFTKLAFDPNIYLPSDLWIVEDCFNSGTTAKECGWYLVQFRLKTYNVTRLEIPIDSELLGESCILTAPKDSN